MTPRPPLAKVDVEGSNPFSRSKNLGKGPRALALRSPLSPARSWDEWWDVAPLGRAREGELSGGVSVLSAGVKVVDEGRELAADVATRHGKTRCVQRSW